jgi:hypothetical protein
MTQPILNSIEKKRAVAIAAVETELRSRGAQAMKDTKHSRFIPKSTIKAVEIKKGGRIVLRADKKLKLHCFTQDPTAVQAFFEPLAP